MRAFDTGGEYASKIPEEPAYLATRSLSLVLAKPNAGLYNARVRSRVTLSCSSSKSCSSSASFVAVWHSLARWLLPGHGTSHERTEIPQAMAQEGSALAAAKLGEFGFRIISKITRGWSKNLFLTANGSAYGRIILSRLHELQHCTDSGSHRRWNRTYGISSESIIY